MNNKFITKTIIVLSMLTTLSFAGEMGHGMKSNHGNMNQNNQHSDKIMNDDMKMNNMKDMDEDSGMMMKKSGNKPSKMSCGAGKCAAGKCGGGK